MRTIDQLVSQEVIYCVSHLVSTMANAYSCFDTSRQPALKEVDELSDQAFELCSPVLDWESAAIEAGWRDNETEGFPPHSQFEDTTDGQLWACGGWQELCEAFDIEPYEREIFEHWIVTDWLADQLEAKGERVAKDVGGMTIWGRTTTGQGIASDSVIADIYADLMKAD